MFGELEALERLASAVGLFGVFVIFGMVSLAFYVRSWGKRHVSEGKAEENDTNVHLAIAEAMKAAMSEVTAQNAVLQTRIFEVNDKLTAQAIENAENKARYEADIAARERERQELITSRGRLEDKLDQLNRANGELRAQMLAMSDRQTRLESEVERYREEHAKAERENGQLKATVAQLQSERAALQTCVNDQQKQITELDAEVSRLKAELRAFYEAEAVLVENADGVAVKKRDTGKLTPPEPAA